MSIVGIQDFISAAIARQVKPDALRPVVNSPPPLQTEAPAAPLPSSTVSSITLQTASIASFTSTAANLAQLGAVLQVSQGGIGQIQSLLQQLQALAGQASAPDISSETLSKIDSQFQQLLGQINKVATGTTFGGTSVLDGSVQQLNVSNTSNAQAAVPKVTLPSLTLFTLFGYTPPNLLSPSAVQQANNSLGNARTITDKAADDVSEARDQAEHASATVQTALANLGASKAVISDTDLLGVFESIVGGFGSDIAATAQVQTGNLSPALLSLLQE